MKKLQLILALLVTSLSLVGCVSDSKDSNHPVNTNNSNNTNSNNSNSLNNLQAPQLRAVHLSPDAPAVDVSVNSSVALQDVTYRQSSGFLEISEGSNNIKVLGANSNNAVIDATLNLVKDVRYTVIAINKLANIEPLVIEDTVDAPTAGFATLNIVHGAVSAPAVDIYVSAPVAKFSDIPVTVQSVSFKGSSGELEVAAGDYRVRVTAAGSHDVIYDSGSISLVGGVQYVAIAADNIGAGVAPIGLTVLTDSSATPFLNVEDVRTQFRAVHASADAPNVDILVDGGLLPSLSNVPFGVGSAYLAVQPKTYNIKINATGTKTSVIDANLLLERGVDYTVAAINPLASIKPLVLVDDNTPPASGNIKLRLVHASPSAGLVDIYITAPNANIFTTSPQFSSVAFEANTGYVEVPAGNYQVRITLAGTKTVAIDTGMLAFSAGQIRTAFAVDPAPGSADFGVILLEDLN